MATTLNGSAPIFGLEHAQCIGWGNPARPRACTTPGSPHKADGRCVRCHSRHATYLATQDFDGAATPSAGLPVTAPAKPWSRNHDACIGWDDRDGVHRACSTTHAQHASHGRCVNCAQKQVKEAEIAATVAPAPQPATDLAVAAKATVSNMPRAQAIAPTAPAFEVYTQVGPVKESGPALTLRLDGSVTINAAAYEALGRPNFVELLYARQERTLGLRACGPTVAHARIVRHDKDNKRTFVSARGLLKFYAVAGALAAPASTRQYGDVLAVQLVVDQAQG